MPEETTETTETAITETPSMFNTEGGFTENWTHSLTDTALHDNETLKTAKSVEALAAMTVSAQKMVGTDKIVIPNEASSEAEWDVFHKAGGKPETAADYNFTRPEELPEENYNQEYVNGLQELLFTHGASKKLADALIQYDTEFKVKHIATIAQDAELAATKLQDGLYADWGNAFEQKKHLGNVAIEQGTAGNPEFKARILAKYGNDPDGIRLMANLGSKFSEAGSPEIALIPSTGDMQNQIDEAMANKAYGPDFKQHGFTKAQHEAQVEKVSQLFLKKQPKGK